MSSNQTSDNLVCFAHGQESGPWGTKIAALSKIAEAKGFSVLSVDYSGMRDPTKRVEKLVDINPQTRNLVLAGSSMGGYVSAVASRILKPKGLFLMAPAFMIPDYPIAQPEPVAKSTEMVHGWLDDVVPVTHSIRYAQKFNVSLHLLSSDHRLTDVLPVIEEIFSGFLNRIIQGQ